jgi:hypothetical protein
MTTIASNNNLAELGQKSIAQNTLLVRALRWIVGRSNRLSNTIAGTAADAGFVLETNSNQFQGPFSIVELPVDCERNPKSRRLANFSAGIAIAKGLGNYAADIAKKLWATVKGKNDINSESLSVG